MKVVLYGARGRLGELCTEALRDTTVPDFVYAFQRDGTFVPRSQDGNEAPPLSLAGLKNALRGQSVLFCDCSIDHSSTEAMERHETAKRDLCAWLDARGALRGAIGFSSGIARLEGKRIRPHADHMRAYRAVKLAQERLFHNLRCPVFIPVLFTLIGPQTYRRQAAAWATVLRWRIEQAMEAMLHDPFTRRFWVDEATVRQALVRFLEGTGPARVAEPLVDGVFSLDDVAGVELPGGHPRLHYAVGASTAWHDGDYLCEHAYPATSALANALHQCLIPNRSISDTPC